METATIWGPNNWVIWHVVGFCLIFLIVRSTPKASSCVRLSLGFGGGTCHWFLPVIFPSPGPAGHSWWISVLLGVFSDPNQLLQTEKLLMAFPYVRRQKCIRNPQCFQGKKVPTTELKWMGTKLTPERTISLPLKELSLFSSLNFQVTVDQYAENYFSYLIYVH